jgi:hypothetical protein
MVTPVLASCCYFDANLVAPARIDFSQITCALLSQARLFNQIDQLCQR